MITRLLAAMLIAALPSRTAAAESLSLVQAFQHFCMATGAHGPDVEKAIVAFGGHEARPAASTDWPFHMTVHIYDLTVDGETATIYFGTTNIPATVGQHGTDDENCNIITHRKNDAAISALRAWAGIPAFSLSDRLVSFSFVTTTKGHVPLPEKPAEMDAAEREGRSWTLIIFRSPDGESVQYIRHHGSPGRI
ncbi:MAG TPA: hypothetical protein VMU08_08310 [Rhizomicrobium sp.]|nr:hypothetical protein [Rhizomicrobium sp.]